MLTHYDSLPICFVSKHIDTYIYDKSKFITNIKTHVVYSSRFIVTNINKNICCVIYLNRYCCWCSAIVNCVVWQDLCLNRTCLNRSVFNCCVICRVFVWVDGYNWNLGLIGGFKCTSIFHWFTVWHWNLLRDILSRNYLRITSKKFLNNFVFHANI